MLSQNIYIYIYIYIYMYVWSILGHAYLHIRSIPLTRNFVHTSCKTCIHLCAHTQKSIYIYYSNIYIYIYIYMEKVYMFYQNIYIYIYIYIWSILGHAYLHIRSITLTQNFVHKSDAVSLHCKKQVLCICICVCVCVCT